jgi:transposase
MTPLWLCSPSSLPATTTQRVVDASKGIIEDGAYLNRPYNYRLIIEARGCAPISLAAPAPALHCSMECKRPLSTILITYSTCSDDAVGGMEDLRQVCFRSMQLQCVAIYPGMQVSVCAVCLARSKPEEARDVMNRLTRVVSLPARPSFQFHPMPGQIADATRELIISWYFWDDVPVYDIAQRVQCGKTVVYDIIRRYRETGEAHARRRGGRPPVLDDDDIFFLERLLAANPSRYLDELQATLRTRRNVDVSLSTLCRTLYRAGLSWKGVSKEAAERCALLRAIWRAENGMLPKDSIVWIDESGVDNRSHQRNGGWSAIGRACVRSQTFLRTERVTMLPALTSEGIIAMDILDETTTKQTFIHFLREQLVRSHSS